MGYEVHITRKVFWSDPDGLRIERDEWSRYVVLDESIGLDEQNGADDFMLSIDSIQQPLWYDGDRGEIHTKNPDKVVMRKLFKIASALDAQVLGDDDERYGPDGELYEQNVGSTKIEDPKTQNKKRFWEIWK